MRRKIRCKSLISLGIAPLFLGLASYRGRIAALGHSRYQLALLRCPHPLLPSAIGQSFDKQAAQEHGKARY